MNRYDKEKNQKKIYLIEIYINYCVRNISIVLFLARINQCTGRNH